MSLQRSPINSRSLLRGIALIGALSLIVPACGGDNDDSGDGDGDGDGDPTGGSSGDGDGDSTGDGDASGGTSASGGMTGDGDAPGAGGSDSATGGTDAGTGGLGNGTGGTVQCPPCAPPPSDNCVGSGICGCGPYTCPGEQCGDVTCEEGMVCCNALSGTCTEPGGLCTQ